MTTSGRHPRTGRGRHAATLATTLATALAIGVTAGWSAPRLLRRARSGSAPQATGALPGRPPAQDGATRPRAGERTPTARNTAPRTAPRRTRLLLLGAVAGGLWWTWWVREGLTRSLGVEHGALPASSAGSTGLAALALLGLFALGAGRRWGRRSLAVLGALVLLGVGAAVLLTSNTPILAAFLLSTAAAVALLPVGAALTRGGTRTAATGSVVLILAAAVSGSVLGDAAARQVSAGQPLGLTGTTISAGALALVSGTEMPCVRVTGQGARAGTGTPAVHVTTTGNTVVLYDATAGQVVRLPAAAVALTTSTERPCREERDQLTRLP